MYGPRKSQLNSDHPHAIALSEAIQQTHTNGGALIWVFKNEETQKILQDYKIHLSDQRMLTEFLQSVSIREALPELSAGENMTVPQTMRLNFFELEGSLIHLLVNGGAYWNWEIQEQKARAVARGFVDLIGAGNRSHILGYRFYEAWTNWFYGIAWDATFVACNLATQKWWLVCVTDTD